MAFASCYQAEAAILRQARGLIMLRRPRLLVLLRDPFVGVSSGCSI